MRENKDVIETASATTSPDNSKSGPFAYVLTGVVVGLVLLLSLAGAGCASYLMVTLSNEYSSGAGSHALSLPYDEFEDIDGFDEWLDQFDEEDGATGSVSTDDALDFDLAAYGYTIDDNISATAYAGTPDEVRSFVRSLVSIDRDYADRLALCLNVAARDEGARRDKLGEAYDLCGEASDALLALDVPALEGDANGEVKDALGTAKSDAARRWELLAEEVGLLQDGNVSTRRLWDVDDEILDATEQAADELASAMDAAAK